MTDRSSGITRYTYIDLPAILEPGHVEILEIILRPANSRIRNDEVQFVDAMVGLQLLNSLTSDIVSSVRITPIRCDMGKRPAWLRAPMRMKAFTPLLTTSRAGGVQEAVYIGETDLLGISDRAGVDLDHDYILLRLYLARIPNSGDDLVPLLEIGRQQSGTDTTAD